MEIGNYDPDPDKHRVSVLPARALDGCSSPPQPGMCHWLGVVRWKILSDRNFWFICVQKKKKNRAILAPIISVRSFIVLLLFLEVLTLTGNWTSRAAGWRLSSTSVCPVSCARWLPIRSACWAPGLRSRCLGQVSEGRQEKRSSSQKPLSGHCQTLHNLCGWPLYVCFIVCIYCHQGCKFAEMMMWETDKLR